MTNTTSTTVTTSNTKSGYTSGTSAESWVYDLFGDLTTYTTGSTLIDNFVTITEH